jgi:hypothetical protein
MAIVNVGQGQAAALTIPPPGIGLWCFDEEIEICKDAKLESHRMVLWIAR